MTADRREILPVEADEPHCELPHTLFLIVAAIPLVTFSNPVWQSLHALAWILLAVEMVRQRRWLVRSPRRLWLPWTFFLLWSLAAALLSAAPSETLYDAKKLLNYLGLFLFLTVLRQAKDYLRILAGLAVVFSLESVWGIVQFLAATDPLAARAHGSFSHHMTFTGLLLIASLLVMPLLSLRPRGKEWLWWSLAILAPLGLVASLTRSAWLALIPGLVVILAFRRPRWLLALPVGLAVLFLAVPQVRSRALSILDTRGDYSNVQRLSIYPTGVRMVMQRPWFGLGSKNQVKAHYPEFDRNPPTPPAAVPGGPQLEPYETPLHLHNNVLEIAAERGLPALLAWLAALGIYFRETWQHLRHRPGREVTLEYRLVLGSLAACVASLSMGMLEYNFGDSEVSILFLLALSIPFVLRRSDAGKPDPRPVEGTFQRQTRIGGP